jgi:hypothetical protein
MQLDAHTLASTALTDPNSFVGILKEFDLELSNPKYFDQDCQNLKYFAFKTIKYKIFFI